MAIDSPHRLAIGFLGVILGAWLIAMFWISQQAQLPDHATGRVYVLFDPRSERDDRILAVTAAGGLPIRHTFYGLLWIAESEDTGFVGRLRAAGAIAAFNPIDISVIPSGGCFVLIPDWKTKPPPLSAI